MEFSPETFLGEVGQVLPRWGVPVHRFYIVNSMDRHSTPRHQLEQYSPETSQT